MINSTAKVLGFFNLFIGLMLTVSILLFIGGFATYLVRLGTWPTYRTQAVEIMMWGVSVLFVLVVVLGAQQFLAAHLAVAVSIIAFIIVAGVAWLVYKGIADDMAKPQAPARNGRREE